MNTDIVKDKLISEDSAELSSNLRELTYGEKLAGTTFNPSNDGDVDKVKQAAASFMNAINEAARNKQSETSKLENQIWEASIMRALEAQMLAVKAITWKY